MILQERIPDSRTHTNLKNARNPTKKTSTNFASQALDDESNSTKIESHWSTFTKERAVNSRLKAYQANIKSKIVQKRPKTDPNES